MLTGLTLLLPKAPSMALTFWMWNFKPVNITNKKQARCITTKNCKGRILKFPRNKRQHKKKKKSIARKDYKIKLFAFQQTFTTKNSNFPTLRKLLHKPKDNLQSCTPPFFYIVLPANMVQSVLPCLLLFDPFNILHMKQSSHKSSQQHIHKHSPHFTQMPNASRKEKHNLFIWQLARQHTHREQLRRLPKHTQAYREYNFMECTKVKFYEAVEARNGHSTIVCESRPIPSFCPLTNRLHAWISKAHRKEWSCSKCHFWFYLTRTHWRS